mgnify:CR=1 FL=1
MAKIIKYKFISCEVNKGTESNPIMEKVVLNKEVTCKTEEEYNTSLQIVESEAIKDSIEISGEFEPMPQPEPVEDRVTELETALSLLLEGATE